MSYGSMVTTNEVDPSEVCGDDDWTPRQCFTCQHHEAADYSVGLSELCQIIDYDREDADADEAILFADAVRGICAFYQERPAK